MPDSREAPDLAQAEGGVGLSLVRDLVTGLCLAEISRELYIYIIHLTLLQLFYSIFFLSILAS